VTPRAARALAALALAASVGACGSTGGGAVDRDPRPGPHDLLVRVLPQEVAEVQRLRATGALNTARAWVARLAAREPDNLPLARLNQDVHLEALGAEALAELRAAAQARLEAGFELVGLLLAARVAPNSEAARPQLDLALELAPQSAWPHYALAHPCWFRRIHYFASKFMPENTGVGIIAFYQLKICTANSRLPNTYQGLTWPGRLLHIEKFD